MAVNVSPNNISVIEVTTPGPRGPQGPSGSQGEQGPAGLSAPFIELGYDLWETTSSIQLTGSLDITGSLTVNTINVGQNTLNFIDENGNVVNSLSISNGNLILLTGSVVSQGGGGLEGTASYALVAEYVINNIDTSSFATTGSNTFDGTQNISNIVNDSFINFTVSSSYIWTLNSDGEVILPGGGLISNPENSSGDGYGFSTLILIPDSTREGTDQYIVLDPTVPNHIHIRAGGTSDNSTAELFLGGEVNNIQVSDASDVIYINTTGSNIWVFNADGNLILPTNGNIYNTNGVLLSTNLSSSNLTLGGTSSIQISGDSQLVQITTSGSNTWMFNADGNLFLPDSGNISTTSGSISASNATFSNILTLNPQHPLPTGVATGSFAVSSSNPPKPYFYNGTSWNALY